MKKSHHHPFVRCNRGNIYQADIYGKDERACSGAGRELMAPDIRMADTLLDIFG